VEFSAPLTMAPKDMPLAGCKLGARGGHRESLTLLRAARRGCLFAPLGPRPAASSLLTDAMPAGAWHLFLSKGDAVSVNPQSPAVLLAGALGHVTLRSAAVASPVDPNGRGSA